MARRQNRATFRGARASNAGDRFHELWALRQALRLLDPSSGLHRITLEGIDSEKDSEGLDAVDCTLYYGSGSIPTSIEIVQLKYSPSNPDDPWTRARALRKRSKEKTSSLLAGLAEALRRVRAAYPGLAADSIRTRFVTNQPIADDLTNALDTSKSSHDAEILAATGFDEASFGAFAATLTLQGQSSSLVALELEAARAIASWTDSDARQQLAELLKLIQDRMLPQGERPVIAEDVLGVFRVADMAGLLPCPARFQPVQEKIYRKAEGDLAQQLIAGVTKVCVHGEGGCGKTTVLRGLKPLLPADSLVLIYDCYGGGSYLDSNGARHAPSDAFMQLSNELASALSIPLLLPREPGTNYARAFARRLAMASELLRASNPNALLVIAADAVDNSVVAAGRKAPPEATFVTELLGLGDLAANVRIVTSARTARLPSLELRPDVTLSPLAGFTREETAEFVGRQWAGASSVWLDDLHRLSRGNPRVQAYALDAARNKGQIENAVQYLFPDGKDLNAVFSELLDNAGKKAGVAADLIQYCAAIATLPRPIPIADLAAVASLSEHSVSDISLDLLPGIRVVDGMVRLADEDFESFLSEAGAKYVGTALTNAAARFLSTHKKDAYASIHVAETLYRAGRGKEVLTLLGNEAELNAIHDPVTRRQAYLHRFKVALKVCREAGSAKEALWIVAHAAAALRSSAAVTQAIVEWPELAARYAPDAVRTLVLLNPDEEHEQGHALFQAVAHEARVGNELAARSRGRQLGAWLRKRTDRMKREKPPGEKDWDVSIADISAEVEATLLLKGTHAAVDCLEGWRPRRIALGVAADLVPKLIRGGHSARVASVVSSGRVSHPWNLTLLVPMALAGESVNITEMERALVVLAKKPRLLGLDNAEDQWQRERPVATWHDIVVTACEIVVARGSADSAMPLLKVLADQKLRQLENLSRSDLARISPTWRAHALLTALGEAAGPFIVAPEPKPEEASETQRDKQERRRHEERQKETSAFLSQFTRLYEVRARILAAKEDDPAELLAEAAAGMKAGDYRYFNTPEQRPACATAAKDVAALVFHPKLSSKALLPVIQQLHGGSVSISSRAVEILSLRMTSHADIMGLALAEHAAILSNRTSAETKTRELLTLAAGVLRLSDADAKALFKEAIEATGELDIDVVNKLDVLLALSRVGSPGAFVDRRCVALRLSDVLEDAGVRLGEFPWRKAVFAIALLDDSVAIASIARWHDDDIAHYADLLSKVISDLLARGVIAAGQAAAMLPLLEEPAPELVMEILKACGADAKRDALAIEMLQDEMRRANGGRKDVLGACLATLPKASGALGAHAARHLAFVKAHDTADVDRSKAGDKTDPAEGTAVSALFLEAGRNVSTQTIKNILEKLKERARERFLRPAEMLSSLIPEVKPGDRTGFLNTLVELAVLDDEPMFISSIVSALEAWKGQPGVDEWRGNELSRALARHLPVWVRWGPDAKFEELLAALLIDSHAVADLLIEGIEANVDELSGASLYYLARVVAENLAANDAAEMATRYVSQLYEHVEPKDRHEGVLPDIPKTAWEALTRFTFAFLGDAFLSNRWKAAHAVRRMVKHLDAPDVHRLVSYLLRREDVAFHSLAAPFYWCSARLWLAMALARSALEAPKAFDEKAVRGLISAARDPDYPHVLFRSFLKDALSALDLAGIVTAGADRAFTKRINRPIGRRLRSDRQNLGREDAWGDEKKRRFHFNGLDTLRYWYNTPVRLFDKLTGAAFLDRAERWIVDEWKAAPDVWKWVDEPRRNRFSRDSMSTYHGHGSIPRAERYSNYLEWHAMWCAAGELLATHYLAYEEPDSNPLEEWIQESRSKHPLWTADLRVSKPLVDRFWDKPSADPKTWMTAWSDDEARQLVHSKDGSSITLNADYSIRFDTGRMEVNIECALVNPETAASFVRASKTHPDPWPYLPLNDDHDFSKPVPHAFVLERLTASVSTDGDLHDKDPLRKGLSTTFRAPKDDVVATLVSSLGHEGLVWKNRNHVAFRYEGWSDSEEDEERGYFAGFSSDGWQLHAGRKYLEKLLRTKRRSLLIKVYVIKKIHARGHVRDENSETSGEEKRQETFVFSGRGS